MSNYIPNSFQVPNGYIDDLMVYLTPEEFKILMYFCREIFGWYNKVEARKNRISLSQITDGVESGKRKTNGIGLSRSATIKSINALVEFGIIAKIGESNKYGQEYKIPDPPDININWNDLRERLVTKKNLSTIRTAIAIKTRKANKLQGNLPITSDDTGKDPIPVLSDNTGKINLPITSDNMGTTTSDNMGKNNPVLSDIPLPVLSDVHTETHINPNTNLNTERETQGNLPVLKKNGFGKNKIYESAREKIYDSPLANLGHDFFLTKLTEVSLEYMAGASTISSEQNAKLLGSLVQQVGEDEVMRRYHNFYQSDVAFYKSNHFSLWLFIKDFDSLGEPKSEVMKKGKVENIGFDYANYK